MVKTTLKKTLDIKSVRGVRLPDEPVEGDKASAKKRGEGTHINNEVWDEFITVGKLLCAIMPDPDIYDLFNFIRTELNGNQPFGEGTIKKVDMEIEKELGAW